MMRRSLALELARLGLIAAVVAAAPRVAAAAGHTCALIAAEVVTIDGGRDDWAGLQPFRVGPIGDAEVAIRCAFDDRALYLSIEVVDDKVVRTRQASARGEDHVSISLTADSAARPLTFRVFPGTATGKRKLDGVPGWVKAEDTLTEAGYAIELSVPLGKLSGFAGSTPVLAAEVLVHDADRPAARAINDTVGLRGRLHFATHLPAYRGFLAATKLAAKDLQLDVLADLDAAPGTERVVWGGRYVGVLSSGFGFLEIPATSASDVLAVRLIDPSASGRLLILTHSRQRGDNGSRELVIVWRLDGGGQFDRVLALEVAQDLGGRTIANRWALVPAGTVRKPERKPNKAALDLVVELGEVVGWDPQAYDQVAPSTDVTPILTPWSERQAAVYWFDGDAALGPVAPRKRRK